MRTSNQPSDTDWPAVSEDSPDGTNGACRSYPTNNQQEDN